MPGARNVLIILASFLMGLGFSRCDASREDGILALGAAQETLQYSPCAEYSKPPNLAFLLPEYSARFQLDQTQYETILVGDSSMDLSSRYPGFLSATTQSVAVFGNTMCDMIMQLPAINTVAPLAIVVSSTGANDLKYVPRIATTQIVNTGALLVQNLRSRFPNAMLVMVAIHPRENEYVNVNKASVNSGVQSALRNSPGKGCFYDPLPLFGVAEGQPARSEDLLDDQTHYNQNMSFKIKAAVQEICKITI
ncbi:MAG: SGNH/GDSL hydrolase family protein [Spirochaetia bacterium]|nr:SGNH/GDSL hydrolase family protein [Spirochaetia bacterium]